MLRFGRVQGHGDVMALRFSCTGEHMDDGLAGLGMLG